MSQKYDFIKDPLPPKSASELEEENISDTAMLHLSKSPNVKAMDFNDFENPLVEALTDLAEEYTRHRVVGHDDDAAEIKASREWVAETVEAVLKVTQDKDFGKDLTQAVCTLVDHQIDKAGGHVK